MSAMPVTDEGLRRKQVKRALFASTVGTSIEWYDFFLYGTAAALVFPDLFFPDSSHYAGVLASFAIYAVGFAARPVGAAIFGHWGDRIGRKATLVATLLLMGIASFLIGLMPTYATLGLWAPTLLVVLRIVQGIGVGGEWGGSVTLSMEWGNPKRRGLVASFPQLGVPIGLLLSTGAVSLCSSLTGDAFESWGWRIPFLASAVLILIGLWVRLRVLESRCSRVRSRTRASSASRRSRSSSGTRARSCSARCCGCPSRCRSTCSRSSCSSTAPRSSASRRGS